jgi:hypothetical protein
MAPRALSLLLAQRARLAAGAALLTAGAAGAAAGWRSRSSAAADEAARLAAVARGAAALRAPPARCTALLRARAFNGWGRASPVVYVPDALLGADDGAALWADVEAWAAEAWHRPAWREDSSRRVFAAQVCACEDGDNGAARGWLRARGREEERERERRFRVVGLADAAADAAVRCAPILTLPRHAAAAAARRALALAAAAAAANPSSAPAAPSLRAAAHAYDGADTRARVAALHAVTPAHTDTSSFNAGAGSWLVVFNVGCAVVFSIAGVEIILRSGDALVFHDGLSHAARHAMRAVLPGSCPQALAPALARGRVALVRVVRDAPSILPPRYQAEGRDLDDKLAAEARAALWCAG